MCVLHEDTDTEYCGKDWRRKMYDRRRMSLYFISVLESTITRKNALQRKRRKGGVTSEIYLTPKTSKLRKTH